jgi:hypothetical protein
MTTVAIDQLGTESRFAALMHPVQQRLDRRVMALEPA